MVVILIIGILIAIALPTFLGARTRAQNRAAQSNLRNAVVAADTWFTDGDTYVGFTDVTALAIEPSLTFGLDPANAAAVTPAGKVFIHVVSANEVVLNALSASGTVYCLDKKNTTGGGQKQGAVFATDFASCTGAW
jgi:type IV pilus assembly protein PilA